MEAQVCNTKVLLFYNQILLNEDPYKAFSEAVLDFHSHYCLNVHDSKWCKFHPATVDDKPYATIGAFNEQITKNVHLF